MRKDWQELGLNIEQFKIPKDFSLIPEGIYCDDCPFWGKSEYFDDQ